MNQTITSDVSGVFNITTGEEYLRVEQTTPDGTKHEMRFRPAEAADMVMRALYLTLSTPSGKALVAASPFYNDVKNLL